jgi:hypothetical protein
MVLRGWDPKLVLKLNLKLIIYDVAACYLNPETIILRGSSGRGAAW